MVRIASKGVLEQDWSSDLDIRIQQEIPFFRESRIKLFLDIENVMNLLNDSHGTKKYIRTTGPLSTVQVINTRDFDPANDPASYENTTIFNGFRPIVETADTLDSLYKIQFGIRGEF